MFECHQTEETFWRTMNPARLHALFNAYLKPQRRTREVFTPEKVPKTPQPELYDLFL